MSSQIDGPRLRTEDARQEVWQHRQQNGMNAALHQGRNVLVHVLCDLFSDVFAEHVHDILRHESAPAVQRHGCSAALSSTKIHGETVG